MILSNEKAGFTCFGKSREVTESKISTTSSTLSTLDRGIGADGDVIHTILPLSFLITFIERFKWAQCLPRNLLPTSGYTMSEYMT